MNISEHLPFFGASVDDFESLFNSENYIMPNFFPNSEKAWKNHEYPRAPKPRQVAVSRENTITDKTLFLRHRRYGRCPVS